MGKKAERTADLFAQAVGLHQRGAAGEAERLYRRVLDADKSHPGALQYLAIIAAGRDDLDEAIRLLTRCARAHPGSAEVRTNLGYALLRAGRADEALAAYDAAVKADPAYAIAWSHRGHCLATLNRPDEALDSYDRAITADPGFADAHYNRGNLLNARGRFAEAIAAFDRSLAIAPGQPLPATNRANALRALGRLEEALAALDRVVAAHPRNALAFANRGHVASDLRRFDVAFESYRRAKAVDPNHPQIAGPLAWAAMSVCDFAAAETAMAAVRDELRLKRSIVQPFIFIAGSDDPALHRACAETLIAMTIPRAAATVPEGTAAFAAPERARLRVAYMSADYRRHPTVPLIAGLLEQHDRSAFEVLAVSTGPDDGGPERRRIVAAVDALIDLQGLSDEAAADLLRAREIDILVDLNGHARGGRLGILARRPAPVQVNYLGYPGTIGAGFVDWLIADDVILPEGCEPHYSEALVRLPGYYAAYRPDATALPAPPSRRDAGLPDDGVVFCSFNNSYKITRPVFDAWMRILAAVPASVLWLLADTPAVAPNLRREAAARGIDPARLVFAERVDPAAHLARHALADLFLDTAPVGAHTTACDALWSGLPMVTCPGRAFPSRVAASLLTAVGCTDLVAPTLAAYEARAVALANDPATLRATRDRLVAERPHLPPFDPDRHRRHMEAAYREMWETRRRGEPPRGITIRPD
ncbi:tetratricopeptide repeat protein [Rhodoplanes sp. TEM]|uniref:protein O-GlcNAc transferase n=1 Tax=Rhodoplanes tepidamans TaxID=200616 RepID=A0ABT5JGK6_RHOTP|nr:MULTISPECIES: tetratricopeptide repeat protein [Rhodoplanes]MDC7788712.1 tetratricopeptide repeat protein [Rhodoplanes tepidamans]MDC7982704.1 tetratricopeptide repeat protein [Rhodoplanes sp. TEM]MDQ0357646.1 putative O-linked N-acetylglucosamine transferase (SPINDLY family) [Rhodoplanes tepidamans]